MVLLCYDHHENVKQINIDGDSGSSSEGETDNETESVSDTMNDHKISLQTTNDLGIIQSRNCYALLIIGALLVAIFAVFVSVIFS